MRGGTFARGLERGREAARELHRRLAADARYVAGFEPELDIVFWTVRAATGADSSRLARAVFAAAAREGLHLALAELPAAFLGDGAPRGAATVTCLRSVLMKPEHLDWLDAIWERLSAATDRVLAG